MDASTQYLRELLRQHVEYTGSVWAGELLNDLRSFIGHFWLVKPKAASIDTLIEDLRRAA
jgi:glutamate synthase (NADPH/NADH) large chain